MGFLLESINASGKRLFREKKLRNGIVADRGNSMTVMSPVMAVATMGTIRRIVAVCMTSPLTLLRIQALQFPDEVRCFLQLCMDHVVTLQACTGLTLLRFHLIEALCAQRESA